LLREQESSGDGGVTAKGLILGAMKGSKIDSGGGGPIP